jgi:hypothetical protein
MKEDRMRKTGKCRRKKKIVGREEKEGVRGGENEEKGVCKERNAVSIRKQLFTLSPYLQ